MAMAMMGEHETEGGDFLRLVPMSHGGAARVTCTAVHATTQQAPTTVEASEMIHRTISFRLKYDDPVETRARLGDQQSVLGTAFLRTGRAV